MIQSKIIPLLLCIGFAACASQASPDDAKMANALGAQGKALLTQGKNAEARDIYQSAVSRDDHNAHLWNGLGVAYDLLGKRDKAKDAYQHAVKLAPNDLVAANNLAYLYLEEGDPASAVRLLAPFGEDATVPLALKQNLAKATKAATAKESLGNDVYADLGSYPTAGMARGRVAEAKKLLGKGAEELSFVVVPEVKVGGGTPVFTIKIVGADPQSICDDLNPKALPCVPFGK